jgi:hypothetical protein
MIGYQHIVTTLGQRLGKVHLTPAQGAAAETVSATLIGVSGFSGASGQHDPHRHIGYCWSPSSGVSLKTSAWSFSLPIAFVGSVLGNSFSECLRALLEAPSGRRGVSPPVEIFR